MLTSHDGRRDGGRIGYLDQPGEWKKYDPSLFDALQKVASNRDVICAENPAILSPMTFTFYVEELRDDKAARAAYFQEFWSRLPGKDLVFFDPDNGLDVPSKPVGRKGSSKYLYRNELLPTWRSNSSILIYQHFPRKERSEFIERIARGIRIDTKPLEVVSFRTPNVVFFLMVQPRHRHLVDRAKAVQQVWGDQIQVLSHPARAENTR